MISTLLPALVVSSAALAGRPDPAPYGAAFDAIHATVAERFYDDELNGVDWDAVGAEHRERAATAPSLEAFAVVVNEMLARLGASHTRVYTSREPAYYQLLGIFRGPLEEEIRAAHPENPELRYPGIGILTSEIEGGTFVYGVLGGSPADEAGLRTGDRIVAVEGVPFHPIGSFDGRTGVATAIEVQRTADPAGRIVLSVTPQRLHPVEIFERAMDASVRLIERGEGQRVGYVRIWSFAGPQFEALLETEIAHGRLRDANALVIDLRGGWGGASPTVLNLFNPRVPVLSQVQRDGSVRDFDPQWRRPVALLVDEQSRSGKEVLAFGFKRFGLGPVIGRRTAGAVLGGQPFLIQPGVLLYLAVTDLLVDGERLEGRGVRPDVPVRFDLPYANGADPQLDAAVRAALTTSEAPAEPVPDR